MLLDALQDSSTSGANVKRLDSESAAAVKNIEKSISSKKKEVSLCIVRAAQKWKWSLAAAFSCHHMAQVLSLTWSQVDI